MLFFDQHSSYDLDSSKSKKLVKWFQVIRVLDLGLPMSFKHKISTDLNMLLHLRYLRIDMNSRVWREFARAIPKFICNLWNLETLDFERSHFILSIPFSNGMWKLKRLRHLHTAGPIILPKFPYVETKTMWNLQTLSCAAINRKSNFVSLIGKGVFPKLRTLGLHFSKDDKHKQGVGQLWENLPNLNCLNALKIYGFPDIPTSTNSFPLNLTKLAITNTNLNTNVMNTLGSLANLRILKLCSCEFTRASRSELELCFRHGFPQLEVFQMRYLKFFRWELGEGVMPCLRRLIIQDCKRLNALPHELWSLSSLREVQVVWPSESLKAQLQSQPMRDGCNLIIYRSFLEKAIERR